MSVLINIDVPDLERGVTFYQEAFGLSVKRRLGGSAAELEGWPVPVFLLEKAEGSLGAAQEERRYERHWSPVHLDVTVDNIEAALARAEKAGAVVERGIATQSWGKIAMLADPFGHGLCLIEFIGRGYGEIEDP